MTRISKNIKLFLAAAFLISLVVCYSSCSKVDTPPGLELTIINKAGNKVPGVIVGLFDSLEEWSMRENPIQVWRETDEDGKVLFIDLKEKNYFFHADGEAVSNIGHEIQVMEPLQVNEIRKLTVTID